MKWRWVQCEDDLPSASKRVFVTRRLFSTGGLTVDIATGDVVEDLWKSGVSLAWTEQAMPSPCPMPEIPDGWRVLAPDEKVKWGDKWWNTTRREFEETANCFLNLTSYSQSEFCRPYIRKSEEKKRLEFRAVVEERSCKDILTGSRRVTFKIDDKHWNDVPVGNIIDLRQVCDGDPGPDSAKELVDAVLRETASYDRGGSVNFFELRELANKCLSQRGDE